MKQKNANSSVYLKISDSVAFCRGYYTKQRPKSFLKNDLTSVIMQKELEAIFKNK